MFERILCPIDFSEGSDHALKLAIAWARHEECALELVHVLEPVLPVGPEVMLLASSFEETTFHELEAVMRQRVKKVQASVPGATGQVLRGIVAHEIVARAKRWKADLIVMGTSGAGAVARVVIGSVADRVVRASPAPVLLVPRDGRAVASIPRRIVTPTDFSPAARAAIARAITLADEVGAMLDVVHAYDVPSFVVREPALAASLRAAMGTEIHAEHPELVERASTRVHGVEGVPAATIVKLTEELGADLVLMASTGRGPLEALLFGGTTDRVVRTARVPVLLITPNV